MTPWEARISLQRPPSNARSTLAPKRCQSATRPLLPRYRTDFPPIFLFCFPTALSVDRASLRRTWSRILIAPAELRRPIRTRPTANRTTHSDRLRMASGHTSWRRPMEETATRTGDESRCQSALGPTRTSIRYEPRCDANDERQCCGTPTPAISMWSMKKSGGIITHKRCAKMGFAR